MSFLKKIMNAFAPDEGLKHPEIQEIEARISEAQSQANTAEFQLQIPHIQRVQILKEKSDAERIRLGLTPKYRTYSEKEKEELLKKYPPQSLSYVGELKKFAQKIGVSQDEIARYKKWIKFYGAKHLSDTTILEFLILQKIKKNSKGQNDPLIQRIEDRRSIRRTVKFKRDTNSSGVSLTHYFRRYLRD